MIIATHNGKFHADDVFAVSLLKQLFPDAEVVRTRDEEQLAAADLVLDVGGVYDPSRLRFDHHQKTSGARDNGVLYSAFGLLWKQYGLRFCDGDEDVWAKLDSHLVQAVDANDNGQDLFEMTDLHVRPVDLSEVIGLFNPLTLTTDEEFDSQFEVAVQLAARILLRMKAKTVESLVGEREFLAAYAAGPDRRYVILDRFVPHVGIATKQEGLLFVVFPNANGDWAIKTVQRARGSFESRVLLPEAWRGLRFEDLAAVTGVADSVFCHKVGFIGAAHSRDGALELLRQALLEAERVAPEYTASGLQGAEPETADGDGDAGSSESSSESAPS